MNCRHCKAKLSHTFLNLGFAPPSNAYLTEDDLNKPEKYYPLKVMVCDHCWLVQTEDYTQADELFNSNYAYFSSTSSSWLEHAKQYSEQMIERLSLNQKSFVVEIASNDGYLLKNFVNASIPCLGIEPTDSTATAAEAQGISVIRQFFGKRLAELLATEGQQADLIAGNNVYAHVPDINDFTAGLRTALKPNGTITLEFPHLQSLIKYNQFDTIYHEHFSYLSLTAVSQIFEKQGLRIYDVEQLPTHGGSLRVFGCHQQAEHTVTETVDLIKESEDIFGLTNLSTYKDFQYSAEKVKNDLLDFLIQQKRDGKRVAAYGAAAKGNTLLNYAGIKDDLLEFVCDAAEAKQSQFMPGSHIPIISPKILDIVQLDYLLVLPWNIFDEIHCLYKPKLPKCKFVVAVPQLKIRD
jgi:hypothetical protein